MRELQPQKQKSLWLTPPRLSFFLYPLALRSCLDRTGMKLLGSVRVLLPCVFEIYSVRHLSRVPLTQRTLPQIFRLAPQDYHRFHSPVDGTVGEIKKVEGACVVLTLLGAVSPSLPLFALPPLHLA